MLIKNAITKSGNYYLFAVPYTPRNNLPIEAYFNKVKTYLKKDRNVVNFHELEKNVKKAIDKVKPENYKNYFEYAFTLIMIGNFGCLVVHIMEHGMILIT